MLTVTPLCLQVAQKGLLLPLATVVLHKTQAERTPLASDMGVSSATAMLLCAAAMLCAAPFGSQAKLDWNDMTSQIHLQNGDVSIGCTVWLTLNHCSNSCPNAGSSMPLMSSLLKDQALAAGDLLWLRPRQSRYLQLWLQHGRHK